MKLGTLRDGTRDGALVVVSSDLRHAVPAGDIAPRLQDALDDWDYCAPRLSDLYEQINRSPAFSARAFEADFAGFAAPLPRACQYLGGSAYPHHLELLAKACGRELPEAYRSEPFMIQGASDRLLGPRDEIALEDESWGLDLGGQLAAVTGDVPMGEKADHAGEHIRLLVLANSLSLRNLESREFATGFGFLQSKPFTAFAPVAITPDELGSAWRAGKLHAQLTALVNGALLGNPNAGIDMAFSFLKLISRAARTRPLSAGTIIGSGTVSNRERKAGSACLAEKRAMSSLESRSAETPFLRIGDTIRIEMLDSTGRTIFGAIEQQVAQSAPPRQRGS